MFGATNPFGQSSGSPFTTQPQFGQTNSASSNPFSLKSFGSPTPFGSQTGGSIFGGTSTGVFGVAQSSSPLGSTTFGASSSPGFGTSMPSFGAASTPAFGSSGGSLFGQKPAFGGFGSTPTHSSPFGTTVQQSQPASGSNLFGSSTPFSTSNQPAFGVASTPAFGSTNTPVFGATNSPSFGTTATNAIGATTTPSFGGTGGAFGVSGTPAFGSGGAFGASATSSAPAFGATSTPAFGGSSSTPSFSFGLTPVIGSSQFGTTGSSFGTQSSAFGTQSTTPAFGNANFAQSPLGGQLGGSRITPYTPTPDADGSSGTQSAGKLESISAMTVYKEKSHEELRWEDLQLGDKGGSNPASQSTTGIKFTQSSPFTSSSTFGQSSSSPFSSTFSNPFGSSNPTGGGPSTPTFGMSPFATQSTPNPFGSTSSSAVSLFATSTPAFTSNPSPIFGTSNSSAFGSSPSIFGSSPAQGSTPAFNSGLNLAGTQSSPLFQSTAPSFGQNPSALGQNTSSFGQTASPFGQTASPFGQTASPFGQTASPFGQTASPFGQTASPFGQTTSPFGQTTSPFGQTASPFGQTASALGQNPPPPSSQLNLFSTPSVGLTGNLFASTPTQMPSSNTLGSSQTTSSFSTPFQSAKATQMNSSYSFGNVGPTPAATGVFAGSSGIFGQSPLGQMPISQSTMALQPAPITNPYGVLPAIPQMSIDRARTSPSIQYGISSMPVVEKPALVRVSPLLTSRHFSQRPMRLPARNYIPKQDGKKASFFNDDEETPSTPKADAFFIPRENPRSLIIRPKEQWSSRSSAEKISFMEETDKPVHENESIVENGLFKEPNHLSTPQAKINAFHDDHYVRKGDSSSAPTGQVSGEATAKVKVASLMPNLRRSDYYTEPSIQELAAKERAEPGLYGQVKNFVIGRHGFGSLNFLGETDVRGLDLDALVQFNNREVIVYLDESMKPPVGEGLNKPAEVTLLNIKCFDKKTGIQYTEGLKIDKYKEMLKKKAEDQGAEFVSYNAVRGEWKFRVNHFSEYKLEEDVI